MLTGDMDNYNVKLANQKEISYGFAAGKISTQEAVSHRTAFLVYAHPYLYDFNTACVLGGFVPAGTDIPVLRNLTYMPFLFLSQETKRPSKNLLRYRRSLND